MTSRCRGLYQPPADTCEICGAETPHLGQPPGYPSAFLRCCPDCRAMNPAERVAAWCRKVERRFT